MDAEVGNGAVAGVEDQRPRYAARVGLAAVVVLCLTPLASPGIALALGVVIALLWGNPYPELTRRISRPLLQASVVCLGFGMDVGAMAAAARAGFLPALGTICLTFLLGAALQRLLALQRTTATLVSAGTAICGGSAVAAVALAIGAAEVEISIAMGTVFLLNAVALYLFPLLGEAMELTQGQFGTWAGIAIHDLSSVVGAASAYGPEALATATAVKLSRTLWIIPVALIAGYLQRRRVDDPRTPQAGHQSAAIPWFIGLFVLASLAGTFLPPVHAAAPVLVALARQGMTLTLLLIGLGLSRASLRAVGPRPILQGVILWLVISVVALLVI